MPSRKPPTQQEIEKHYFGMFRNAYTLPPGTIVHGDKPDVIVHGDRKVGIEITNFYVADGASSNSEQVQSRRRAAAVAEAQRLYTEATGNNIQLAFGFDKFHPIQDSGTVANKIVELAHRVHGGKDGSIRKKLFDDIPELSFVHLYSQELVYPDDYFDPQFPNGQPDASEGFPASRDYRNRRELHARNAGVYRPLSFPAKWQVVQCHDFGLMSIHRLTEIVREKEKKASKYTSCDAYWLLVVVNFIDSAQEQEIRIAGGVDISSDVFEKIIVWKTYFDHIAEITPQPMATPV